MKPAFFLFFVLSSTLIAQPGALDSSFGNGGIVVTDFGLPNDRATAVAFQTDGKLVVAAMRGGTYEALYRLNADGSPDYGFGANGVLQIDSFQFNYLRTVATQPDDKILVASDKGPNFRIVRLLAQGFADPEFGTAGVVDVPISNVFKAIYSLLVQPDGKIVAGGFAPGTTSPKDEYVLVRLNNDGTPDAGFGNNGVVRTDFGSSADDAWVVGMALQPDGKLLATGFAQKVNNDYDVSLARFNADGSLDQTFGNNGRVTVDLGSTSDEAESVFVLPDGKITLLANTVVNGEYHPALLQFNPNGSLDNSFGSNGISLFPSHLAVLKGILQPDNKVVGVGYYHANGHYYGALIRFNSDGTPDQSFGISGFATAGNAEVLHNIALQQDGKIVTVGNTDKDCIVLRYFSGLSVATHVPAEKVNISIHPNPATDFIEIETGAYKDADIHLTLFDSRGRLLRSASFNNHLRWEVKSLPAGIYHIGIQGGGRAMFLKN